MADNILNCPECGKPYNISTFKPGMKFRCTKCNMVVTVPDAQADAYDDYDSPRGRSRGAAAPPPRRGGSRKPEKRRRDEFDEDVPDRGRGVPKKSDTTLYVALGITAAVLVVIIGVMALVKAKPLDEIATLPPEALGTESPSQFNTPNWSHNPITTNPKNTGKSHLDTSEAPKPDTTVTDGKLVALPTYKELKDCGQDVQAFVDTVVNAHGGAEALKFNASCKMQINIRANCQLDPGKPNDPYAWLSDSDMPTTFYWKRAGTVNKVIYEQRQASRVVWQLFDGKTYSKFIDKDKADSTSGEQRRFAMDAYDFDVMYKLSSGRFLLVDEIRARTSFEFAKERVKCSFIRVQDRFDRSIRLSLYFFDESHPDKNLLGKIQYDDEINNENVNKFYWSYHTKSKMSFPLITLINRTPKKKDPADKPVADIRIFQIFKDDAEELGEIEFGVDIADYLFERPKD